MAEVYQDGPASNTRQRKASDLSGNSSYSNMANPTSRQTEDNGLSLVISNNNYAMDVLHNPSKNIQQIKVLQQQESTCENMIKGRKSVVELVSDIENMSPINSPFNLPNVSPSKQQLKGERKAKEYKGLTLRKGTVSVSQEKQKEEEESEVSFANNMATPFSAQPINRNGEQDEVNSQQDTEVWYSQSDRGDEHVQYAHHDSWSNRSVAETNGIQPSRSSQLSTSASLQHSSEYEVSDSQSREVEMDIQRKIQRQREIEEVEEIIKKYKQRLRGNDPTVMFEMFELMLTKISQVQNKLTSIETEVSDLQLELSQSQRTSGKASIRVKKINQELNKMGEVVTDLMHVTASNEQNTSSVRAKVELLEARSLKGAWVIRGIKVEEQEDPKSVVTVAR